MTFVLNRFKSFQYAFNGLLILMKEEINAIIHVFLSLIVIVLGISLKISLMEWMILIAIIGFVISLEIINSAIENLANIVSPLRHPIIKKVKDLSAAAVLFYAFIALIIGLMIFIPKLCEL